MYIAAGQGQTTPGNKILMSLRSFATSFKQISLKSNFIHFFYDFIHIFSPGAGTDNPLGTKSLCQREQLVTLVICSKFQTNLFEVLFHDFIHVYSPGAGADNPRGQNCDVNRNLLSLRSFATSLKKSF